MTAKTSIICKYVTISNEFLMKICFFLCMRIHAHTVCAHICIVCAYMHAYAHFLRTLVETIKAMKTDLKSELKFADFLSFLSKFTQ